MSWIEKLYQTYESSCGVIGNRTDRVPLLPICHTTQKAHIQIVVDGDGNFVRAAVVPKSEATTIVPATEESAGRTSGPTPHPLCDKLQYVAMDYAQYGGEKDACFGQYLSLLRKWLEADSDQPRLRAVAAYVSKGRVISDLVGACTLHTAPGSSKLLNRWPDEDNAPEIFKLLPGGADSKGNRRPWQADAFVRWSVEIGGESQSAVWTDPAVWQSWVDYYGGTKAHKELCYVTGEQRFMASQHPAKIRSAGDKAKLISSNDTSGYTFRGRFTSAGEACGVSFEVTQKAHSALRWLIARQGYQNGDQAIVAWAVSGAKIPDPLADTYTLLSDGESDGPLSGTVYTAQEIGVQLTKRMAGYAARLGDTTDVVVMGLDSATAGRMAITYYRELTGSELLERVQTWHEGCCWHQNFGEGKRFVGAPAPRDIAVAAYGRRLDDRLCNATVQRLLPCIVDGIPVPRDLVDSCVRRAGKRHGMEPWEWEKTLGIACALFRYYHQERGYPMALDRERRTRDYLYGRLLALAEHLEGRALYVAGEERETNAARLMQRFGERPYTTWLTIETGLTPYRTRLRTKRSAFLHNTETEIDEVMSLFVADDFISDQQLTGEFLLAYHCERRELRAGPD
jgi:CRISPR-associated protein Csd1